MHTLMELTHRFTVPISTEEAWSTFNDLETIVPCFPGAALMSFDGERFEGGCKVKLGPVSLQYTGSGRFVERDAAAKRVLIEANGKDKRGNGTAAATITARLTASGDDTTAVEVTTDLTITGRPAQFGRGVMQDVSDRLLAQFSSCLEAKLGSANPQARGADAAGTAERVDSDGRAGAFGAGPTAVPADDQETLTAVPADDTSRPAADRPTDAVSPLDTKPGEPTELDLSSAVLPVLLRRYGPPLVAVVVAVVLVRRLIGRR
jgi:carbon monoxide dehydrogenase subunit G